jgi:glycosidase
MPDAYPALAKRLLPRLTRLYGAEQAPTVLRQILRIVHTHSQLRTRILDTPGWSEEDVLLITYGDSIQAPAEKPLQTLKQFVDTHLREEIGMLHILPFFPWSSDDGFSVTDFRAVNAALGSWDDIAALGEHFDLTMDLVLNHCSRENLWFVDYIAGQKPACDYFIEVDENTNLSLVTRPRSTPLLAGVRTRRGLCHVWATFSNDQIDLNYHNPTVLLEFIDLLLYYLRRGARMIRLDAVAYLWKEIGTNCIHLPQTHEVVKLFRDIVTAIEPGALLMTETNVPQEENISYFGAGDEAQVVYQFSLPPLLLHAIHSGNTHHLLAWAQALQQTPLPAQCTFLNFTASHDGIGLRPLEGLVPAAEITALLAAMRERGGYVSTKSNSDGTVSPYELNISYFDAFRDPHGENNAWHIPRFLLSQIFALSLRGIPAVYIHSLLATPNDLLGVERTGMTRAINRRKLDRGEVAGLLANPDSETGRVFWRYRKILRLRRRQAAFHPDAAQHILALPDGLFGLLRSAADNGQRILCLYNFRDQSVTLSWDDITRDFAAGEELLQEAALQSKDGEWRLAPYGAYWLSLPAAG